MAKEPFAALNSTLWIGGLFFWLMRGFRGNFSDQISEKYRKRNFIVGYAMQIAILGIAVYQMVVKR